MLQERLLQILWFELFLLYKTWINLYEEISILDYCPKLSNLLNLCYKTVNIITMECLLYSRKSFKCLTCICSFNHYVIPWIDYNDCVKLLMKTLRCSMVILKSKITQKKNVKQFLNLILLIACLAVYHEIIR